MLFSYVLVNDRPVTVDAYTRCQCVSVPARSCVTAITGGKFELYWGVSRTLKSFRQQPIDRASYACDITKMDTIVFHDIIHIG